MKIYTTINPKTKKPQLTVIYNEIILKFANGEFIGMTADRKAAFILGRSVNAIWKVGIENHLPYMVMEKIAEEIFYRATNINLRQVEK
jgi:hypothetical protein